MKRFNLNNKTEAKANEPINKIEEQINEQLIANQSDEVINDFEDELIDEEINDLKEEEVINNSRSELISERSEYARHYVNPNGTLQAVFSNEPQFYYDETTKQYEDIDNSLTEVDGYLTNKNAKFKVRFAKQLKDKEIFKMSKDGFDVSLKFLDEFKNDAKITRHRQSKGDKKHSRLTYKRFKDNVDLEYRVTPKGVKENIIINKRQDNYIYTFKLEAKGMELVLNEEQKCINVVRLDTNDIVFMIPAPVMYDSNDVKSDDVSFEVEGDDGEYTFKVIASSDWINADERAFPVVVDPEVVVNNSGFLYCKATTHVPGGVLYTTNDLYIKPIQLQDKKIARVILKMKLNPGTSDYTLYMSANSFFEMINYSKAQSEILIDATKLMKDNVERQIAFYYLSSSGIPAYISMPFDLANSQIIIDYKIDNAMDNPELLLTQSIGRGGTYYENILNGKKRFEHLDINGAKLGFPLDITHVYDFTGENKYRLGYGWHLNLHQSLQKNISLNDNMNFEGIISRYTDQYGDSHNFIEKYYYFKNGVKIFVPFKDCKVKSKIDDTYYYQKDDESYDVYHAAFNDNNSLTLIADYNSIDDVSNIIINNLKDESYYLDYNGERYEISQYQSSVVIKNIYFLDENREIDFSQLESFYETKCYRVYDQGEKVVETTIVKRKDVEKVIFRDSQNNPYIEIVYAYDRNLSNPVEKRYYFKKVLTSKNYSIPKNFQTNELLNLVSNINQINSAIEQTNTKVIQYTNGLFELLNMHNGKTFFRKFINYKSECENKQKNYNEINLAFGNRKMELFIKEKFPNYLNTPYFFSLNDENTEKLKSYFKKVLSKPDDDILDITDAPYLFEYLSTAFTNREMSENRNAEKNFRVQQYLENINELSSQLSEYIKNKENIIIQYNNLIADYKKQPTDYIIDNSNNILGFDSFGRLVYTNDSRKKEAIINYENDIITSVMTNEDKSIIFEYNEFNLLKTIRDNLGRETKFAYDLLTLIKIIYPDGEEVKLTRINSELSGVNNNQFVSPDGTGFRFVSMPGAIDRSYFTDCLNISNNNIEHSTNKNIESYKINKYSDMTLLQETISQNENEYYFDLIGNIVALKHSSSFNATVNYEYNIYMTDKTWRINSLNKQIGQPAKIKNGFWSTTPTMVTSPSRSGQALAITGKIITNSLSLTKMPANRIIIVSAWANANSFNTNGKRRLGNVELTDYIHDDSLIDARKFALNVEVTYGTESEFYSVDYDYLTVDWQIGAIPIKLKETDETIRVKITLDYSSNNGTAYFDEVMISEGEFTEETYYEDGKLKSSYDGRIKSVYEEYSQDLPTLVKIYDDEHLNVEGFTRYEYDSHKHLIYQEDHTGMVVENIYDDEHENLIMSKTYHRDEPTNCYISEYRNNDEGQIEKEIHPLGKVEGVTASKKYQYNNNTNLLSSVTDYNRNAIHYGYDIDNDNLLSVSTTVDGEPNNNVLSYNKGYLTRLVQNDTFYDYTYEYKGRIAKLVIGNVTYFENTYIDSTSDYSIHTIYGNGYQEKKHVEHDFITITMDYNNTNQLRGIVHNKELEEVTYSDGYSKESKVVNSSNPDEIITNYSNDKVLYMTKKTKEKSNEYTLLSNTLKYDCTFDDDLSERLNKVETPLMTTSIKYDKLGRIKGLTGTDNNAKIYKRDFSYLTNGERTTKMVSQIKHTINNVSELLSYKYDANGNIIEVKKNGELLNRYTYDSMNRLIREDNTLLDKTYTYQYDSNGNILSKVEYKGYKLTKKLSGGTRIDYGYSSDKGWYDQLTAFGDLSITYDDIGNPINYFGHTFKWQFGRLLSKVGNDIEYTYNYDNIRCNKIVDGIETKYYLDGNKVIAQESNGDKLFFIYGSDGIEGFYINEIDNYYIYQKNLQGDITHVYNSSGVLEAEYRYDAWGNHEVINHSSMLIGDVNPFRYRSYYFDVETGLYYLNSRYYDPEVGRFINADDVSYLDPESINGLNLYAYCLDNPIMYCDPNGNFAILTSIFIGLAISLIAESILDVVEDGIWFNGGWERYAIAGATGTLSGFFAGLGTALKLGFGAGLALSALSGGAIELGAGILKGDVQNFGDGFWLFTKGAIIAGASYTIAYGLTKYFAGKRLDGIVKNWNADNTKINKRLAEAGLGMFKIGRDGYSPILKHVMEQALFVNLRDGIGFGLNFVTNFF